MLPSCITPNNVKAGLKNSCRDCLVVEEWKRDGSSGWVSSSQPSPAPHKAADMTRALCASLSWALLSLRAGTETGSPFHGQEPLSVCPAGRAAVSAQVGTDTQWAAGFELHTSPSALEAGTQHRAQKTAWCCKGQRISLPISPCDREGTLNPVW